MSAQASNFPLRERNAADRRLRRKHIPVYMSQAIYTVWNDGWDVALDGKAATDCPYPKRGWPRHYWLMGWNAAQEAYAEPQVATRALCLGASASGYGS